MLAMYGIIIRCPLLVGVWTPWLISLYESGGWKIIHSWCHYWSFHHTSIRYCMVLLRKNPITSHVKYVETGMLLDSDLIRPENPQVLLVFREFRPRYVWGSNPAKTINRLCELGTLTDWPRLGKFTTETIGGTQVIFWHIGGAMAEFNDWPKKPWLFLVTMENPPLFKSHGFWYFWWIFHCYFKVSDGD